MMTRVFVVTGETGEYDDKRDWLVKAFFDEDKANALSEKLNLWCIANDAALGSSSYPTVKTCPLDKKFQADRTGTRYYCWTMPVSGKPKSKAKRGA